METNIQPVRSFSHRGYKADIYSSDIPGEFRVVYRDSAGEVIEEAPLTGISTYHQREPEIRNRLLELSHGAEPDSEPDRGDAGEY